MAGMKKTQVHNLGKPDEITEEHLADAIELLLATRPGLTVEEPVPTLKA
jgi:hypothetical protein